MYVLNAHDNNKATKTKSCEYKIKMKRVCQKKDLERFWIFTNARTRILRRCKTHTQEGILSKKKKKKWISFTDEMTPITKNKLKISQQHNNPLASKKNRQNK